MKLRIRVQRELVIAHRAEHDGAWVFSLCRRGFGELIGQRLRTGEEWLVEVTGHPIEKLKEGGRNAKA